MANPPITIGPFNNVPAPGSPIASNWPQSISTLFNTLWTAPRVQSWIAYYTTDAAGFARINYPAAFSAATPIAVSMLDADPQNTAGPHIYGTREVYADSFYVFSYRHDGVPHANSALAARVIAAGPR